MKKRQIAMILFTPVLLIGGVLYATEGRVLAEPAEAESGLKQVSNTEPRARMGEKEIERRVDAKTTLKNATDLYAAVVKGPHGQVPDNVLANAKCVAVIPDVTTGAMIIGGSHGVGVASCKENQTWSQPTFLQLNAISFGAQLGGKSSDLVLFMMTEDAKAALKKGKVTFGSDISVAAGTFDRDVDTSKNGVIAYTRSEGVCAGASIAGASISSNESDTTAFYGKEIGYRSLLEGTAQTEKNDLSDRFTALLPR